jgi:3-methyl-2-oxobutanoate hydroxymethyltransferase
MNRINVSHIKAKKNQEKIVMITAYDALFARLLDDSADILLVGDSLNMSFNGRDDTLSITFDEMLYHTKAVCRGSNQAMILFDMPFGTYTSKKEALAYAKRVYQESDAAAVKIEGGEERVDIIKELTKNSIAVMGHIGLMPQFVRSEGGYKVKGRNDADLKRLIKDAKAIEKAGAFALVIEGVVSDVAKEITKAVSIPTIGIGAGSDTDGQVLVWSDMFGFFEAFTPKFVKKYFDGAPMIRQAAQRYAQEVKDIEFPTKEYEYH